MILLFGEKAAKQSPLNKNSNIKNHPVENSGILASADHELLGLLSRDEYDTYVFSSTPDIDYTLYAQDFSCGEVAFLSDFSMAASLGADSYSSVSDCGCGGAVSSCSCAGSFSSVC